MTLPPVWQQRNQWGTRSCWHLLSNGMANTQKLRVINTIHDFTLSNHDPPQLLKRMIVGDKFFILDMLIVRGYPTPHVPGSVQVHIISMVNTSISYIIRRGASTARQAKPSFRFMHYCDAKPKVPVTSRAIVHRLDRVTVPQDDSRPHHAISKPRLRRALSPASPGPCSPPSPTPLPGRGGTSQTTPQ